MGRPKKSKVPFQDTNAFNDKTIKTPRPKTKPGQLTSENVDGFRERLARLLKGDAP